MDDKAVPEVLKCFSNSLGRFLSNLRACWTHLSKHHFRCHDPNFENFPCHQLSRLFVVPAGLFCFFSISFFYFGTRSSPTNKKIKFVLFTFTWLLNIEEKSVGKNPGSGLGFLETREFERLHTPKNYFSISLPRWHNKCLKNVFRTF